MIRRRPAPVVWLSCGGCFGQFALEPQCAPRGRDPEWFCAGCAPARARARAAIPLERNRIAVHVDYQNGPFAELVILAVNGGDQVDVQALGHPGRGGWDGRCTYHRSELLLIR